MPPDPLKMLQVGAALLLGAAGVWLLASARRHSIASSFELPGVGRTSNVTRTVAGLACALVAYHLFAYAMNLAQYRGPIWIVLSVGVLAPGLSLLIDAIENRADSRDDD